MKRALTFTFLALVLRFPCGAQQKEPWIHLPKDRWPKIALINKVQYKNGDSYVHSSFVYAGTGFLIDNDKDTLAATAKHVLWIAQNKRSGTVQVNDELKSWVMAVKGNNLDSVVIGKLLNEDSTELLQGAGSTILERDAIFFTVKKTSSNIHALKPRYTEVEAGEKVYFLSCAYADSAATVHEGVVLRKLGMDILIEREGEFRGGASGSPVIDANGHLIGIASSSTTEGRSGKPVTVALSTEYLQNVLAGKPGFNTARKDYGILIYNTVLKKGVKKAIRQYHKMVSNPRNYYRYNLYSANRNGLRETGEKLLELKRYQDAVEILKLNVRENSGYYLNFNILATAQLLAGNKAEAIHNYRLSTTKLNDKKENDAFKELEKLLSPK